MGHDEGGKLSLYFLSLLGNQAKSKSFVKKGQIKVASEQGADTSARSSQGQGEWGRAGARAASPVERTPRSGAAAGSSIGVKRRLHLVSRITSAQEMRFLWNEDPHRRRRRWQGVYEMPGMFREYVFFHRHE